MAGPNTTKRSLAAATAHTQQHRRRREEGDTPPELGSWWLDRLTLPTVHAHGHGGANDTDWGVVDAAVPFGRAVGACYLLKQQCSPASLSTTAQRATTVPPQETRLRNARLNQPIPPLVSSPEAHAFPQSILRRPARQRRRDTGRAGGEWRRLGASEARATAEC